jgi:hypothetical protein
VDETFKIQAAVLFWVLVCLFRYGAMSKGLPMNVRRWFEIALLALLCVGFFAFLTEARGCRQSNGADFDASIMLIQPGNDRLGHGQRWAHFTTGNSADGALANSAFTGNLGMLSQVGLEPGNQALRDGLIFHIDSLTLFWIIPNPFTV